MVKVVKSQRVEYECHHVANEDAPRLWTHKLGGNTWLALCPFCFEELRTHFFTRTIEKALSDGIAGR